MFKAKWIDISVGLKSNMACWPGNPEVKIESISSIAAGKIYNASALSLCVHSGTHMDAPRHLIKNGPSMDRLPIEAVVGPARVINITDRVSIKPEELKKHRLQKGERILFRTSGSGLWKKSGFIKQYVHITAEAAQYIVSSGVITVGIDYLSVGSFEDGVVTHQILLRNGVWIIEGLNLSQVKPGRYDLICLPIKILDSDGAMARAVIRPRKA
jgi:arylformamidase